MRATRLSSTHECAFCHHALDAATSIDPNAVPKEGDVTICLYCGNWLQFGENLTYMKPDEEAMKFLAADAKALKTQSFIRNEIRARAH